MLLNIYLGTTAISIITDCIFTAALLEKIKREGYKSIKVKKSIFESIANYMSMFLKVMLPGYNIINAIALLWAGFDKVYKNILYKELMNGNIYMPTKEKVDSKDKNLSIEKEIVDSKDKNLSNEEVKTYNEMTREEKLAWLEHERELLVEQDEFKPYAPILKL